MAASPAQVPPGWYPYPPEPGFQRWWDGNAWGAESHPLPAAPPPAAKSGGNGCLIAVFVIIGLVVIGVLGVGTLGAFLQGAVSGGDRADSGYRVVYTATGSAAGANVTYGTATGQEQHDVSLPMTSTDGQSGVRFEADQYQPLTILVQNLSDTGNVSCSISVNGTIVSKNQATAPYGIATCSAMAGD